MPSQRQLEDWRAGGACYELELYPIVARCRGLQPGAYHYDPLGHRLCPLQADESGVARMLRGAGAGMGQPHEPDILICDHVTLPARGLGNTARSPTR